jgi:hypothetical protein
MNILRHLFCRQIHPDALKTVVRISCLHFMLFFLITAHKFMKMHMNNPIINFYNSISDIKIL